MWRARTLLAALGLAAGQAAVAADFSANVGFMSEYFFRGIKQSDATAYAGLDLEAGGFYLGTWAADVERGLEYDLYTGYGGTFGDFSYGLGYTGYFYTDDFDDTYQELNASVGWKFFSLNYDVGQYENFEGPTQDYGHWAVKAEYEGFYVRYAGFEQDLDGNYAELGWSTEISGIEVGAYLLYSDETLADGVDGDSGETSLVFTVGKTFGLGSGKIWD
jgi:uncharacterized protein (TIGR02001 family)